MLAIPPALVLALPAIRIERGKAKRSVSIGCRLITHLEEGNQVKKEKKKEEFDVQEALAVTPKFGQQLIREAVYQTHEKSRLESIEEVKAIITRVQMLDHILARAKAQLEICRDQLAAINAGKFTIRDFPAREIVFHEARLNVPLDSLFPFANKVRMQ
jgi:hypothetical protein